MEIEPKAIVINELNGSVKEIQIRYFGVGSGKVEIDLYPDYNRGNIQFGPINKDYFLDPNGVVLQIREVNNYHQYYLSINQVFDKKLLVIKSTLPMVFKDFDYNLGTTHYLYNDNKYSGSKHISLKGELCFWSEVIYGERKIARKVFTTNDKLHYEETLYLDSEGRKEKYVRNTGDQIWEEIIFKYEKDILTSYKEFNYQLGKQNLQQEVYYDTLGRIQVSNKQHFCDYQRTWRWCNYEYEYSEQGYLSKCSGNIVVYDNSYNEVSFLYDFDSQKNWIKRHHLYDGQLKYITKRSITYY